MSWHLSPSPVVCCDCSQAVTRSSNRQKRCEPCQRAEHAARARRDRAASPEKVAELNRKYRAANRERLLEADRQRYRRRVETDRSAERTRVREIMRRKRALERARKIEQGWRPRTAMTPEEKAEKVREQGRRRYREDTLRWRMAAAVKRVLRGKKLNRPWTELVGYSVEELRRHIERQFLPGMTWANIGKWHVDHIIPLSAFKYAEPEDEDFKAAWALTNLRPLWSTDNQKKHSKRLTLL